MGRLRVVNNVTVDGVMQAPGRPDEDPRGGFEHGGWALPYNDSVTGRVLGERMAAHTGALLLGRRTYEDFAGYWPHQQANPFTEMLTKTTKYVVSRTLTEPLPWDNSVLVSGDAADAVSRLKEQQDLVVLGSGRLLGSLIRHDLVDEYLLLIHPLILGSGTRLFGDDAAFAQLRLIDSVRSSTGVVLATYERPQS
ncbi:Dihydrofolate reductase [Amycolatopsis marina]|uniref:Dihydrofolate reductase n=1 Tax=Amycolatopsis marina TaxID=490629 RepID=A0A1I1B799_9PSEU|nr:dihydrofolate reductase family protein [Amycolatopsis marina]SFB44413.1 Dihydrofolate reductase [Amycolatopsis marina]